MAKKQHEETSSEETRAKGECRVHELVQPSEALVWRQQSLRTEVTKKLWPRPRRTSQNKKNNG
jgi:hypothetical protein